MNETELFELINQELDGRNTPAGSERLARLLAEDPRARRLSDEMSALHARLGQLAGPEPPAGLEAELSGLARPAASAPRPVRWLDRLLPGRPGFRPRFALAAAILVAILAVGLPLLYLKWAAAPAISPDALAGSMVPLSWGPIGPASDQMPMQFGDITGHISLHPSEDQYKIVIRYRIVEPFEMEICFDPSAVRPAGLLQDPRGVPVQTAPGGPCLRFTIQGDCAFLVPFDKVSARPAAFRVRVLREHSVIIDGSLGAGAVRATPAERLSPVDRESQHATTEEAI